MKPVINHIPQAAPQAPELPPGLLGDSAQISRLRQVLTSLRDSPAPVLIEGEAGSGKGLLARAVHLAGPRRHRPLVCLACNGKTPQEQERDFLGNGDNAGPLASSSGGDIFISEIFLLPLSLQTKLLALLQGPKKSQGPAPGLDLRIIASSSQDLAELAARGHFRSDLFYRLKVVPLTMPPLRQRPADMPLVADAMLAELSHQVGRACPRLSPQVYSLLEAYHWPGNLTELHAALAHALANCPGREIAPVHLPHILHQRSASGTDTGPKHQRRQILHALEEAEGNRSQAARILGVSRVTFYKRLKRLGLEGHNG